MIQDTAQGTGRYLVINADDLGRSLAVNAAIAEAHDNGIVTAASIMAGGDAFHDGVRVALRRRRLSIGLHVTLCDGKAVLPHSEIPDLTDAGGYFEKGPAAAGMKYMDLRLLPQIEREVKAQFERVEKAGVSLTHVDSHHHLHMHPLIFKMLCRIAAQKGVRWIRLPEEPMPHILRSRSSARGVMPFIEWAVFGPLGRYNRKSALKYGLRVANRVYGLSRTGGIDEGYLIGIICSAGGPVTEIFAHPDLATASGRRELDALSSVRVSAQVRESGVSLAGYGELTGDLPRLAPAGGRW